MKGNCRRRIVSPCTAHHHGILGKECASTTEGGTLDRKGHVSHGYLQKPNDFFQTIDDKAAANLSALLPAADQRFHVQPGECAYI